MSKLFGEQPTLYATILKGRVWLVTGGSSRSESDLIQIAIMERSRQNKPSSS
jgi:hypothetical protein